MFQYLHFTENQYKIEAGSYKDNLKFNRFNVLK